MTDPTLRIKNLSIALEALSRFHLGENCHVFNDITALLEEEIRKEQEEQIKATQWPAKPRTNTTNTDDTPF